MIASLSFCDPWVAGLSLQPIQEDQLSMGGGHWKWPLKSPFNLPAGSPLCRRPFSLEQCCHLAWSWSCWLHCLSSSPDWRWSCLPECSPECWRGIGCVGFPWPDYPARPCFCWLDWPWGNERNDKGLWISAWTKPCKGISRDSLIKEATPGNPEGETQNLKKTWSVFPLCIAPFTFTTGERHACQWRHGRLRCGP